MTPLPTPKEALAGVAGGDGMRRRAGLLGDESSADRVAFHLGLHPLNIWSEPLIPLDVVDHRGEEAVR